jgi:hypothetical protein
MRRRVHKNGYGSGGVPSIVIPTIKRVFPSLVAHDIVGVQPMDGHVGMAFALRHKYGKRDKNGFKR